MKIQNRFLLALLLVLSCSKARELPEPGLVINDKSGNETVVSKQEKKEESSVGLISPPEPVYKSTILTIEALDAPAKIILQEEDAKALYEALQVQTFDLLENNIWGAGKRKSGKYIECNQQVKKAQPEKILYSCLITINPITADLTVYNNFPLEDKTLPHPDQDYFGRNIQIDSSELKVTVNLSGEDAKILFHTINKEEVNETNQYGQFINKFGGNLGCYKKLKSETNPELFFCYATLKISDGSLPFN